MIKSKLKLWGALIAAVAATLAFMSPAVAAASTPQVAQQSAPTSQILKTAVAAPDAIGITFVVVHSGLFVDSATVTNNTGPAGVPRITNSGNGAVHTGTSIGKGQHFTVGFNRDVASGDTICGQVGNSTKLCVQLLG